MAPCVRCLFIAGLLLGGALALPLSTNGEPSSISETQVPSVQTRVLPASTKPIPPTQELADDSDKVATDDSSLTNKSEEAVNKNDTSSSMTKRISSTTTTTPAATSSPSPLPVRDSLSGVAKRRNKKKANANSTTPPTKLESIPGTTRSDGTYVLKDSDGITCVLAYFKAKITVAYPIDEKNNKYKRVVLSPPTKVGVDGVCDRDSQKATMNLTWTDGILTLKFDYDSLIDSWYVSEFSFNYDTSTSRFKGAETKELVTVKSDKSKRFWTTSHSRSFRCLLLHDVTMKDKEDRYSGIIHFDEARVQALTKTDTFKTPKHCIHRVHRDEMVPVAVGGALAASTLLTVIGYAIFRYIKVKKFQYNTME